ncbi:MAG: hypothetical protein AB7L91_07095 [Dehalococcoidia bacterium]
MAQEARAADGGGIPRSILPFPGVMLDKANGAVLGLRHEEGPDGWGELRDRLLDCWPVLTEAELEATRGDAALIGALIEAKLGYARRLLDEAIRPWELQTRPAEHRAGRGLLGLISVHGLPFIGARRAISRR